MQGAWLYVYWGNDLFFCIISTKLDRADTKDFKMREQRAEKLAKEIEGSSNKHGIDDVGTEEEL